MHRLKCYIEKQFDRLNQYGCTDQQDHLFVWFFLWQWIEGETML